MRSAWFWSSPQWAEYLAEYAKVRPDCLNEYRSSPLADDHDLAILPMGYHLTTHQTQVLDLTVPLAALWSKVRKSYHALIHRAQEQCVLIPSDTIACYAWVHAEANGGIPPRNQATYDCQDRWLGDGHALLVEAWLDARIVAAAYWIVYQGCAYYASGPAIEKNVQHAVLWKSIELLKAKGVRLVELGQIDGETEKERNIGKFKSGWGGIVQPFTVVKRRAA